MTTIRNIFDADATELHDLRADPNTIIKIQGLVKEMGVAILRFDLMPPRSRSSLQDPQSDVMSHTVFGVPVVGESAENSPNLH